VFFFRRRLTVLLSSQIYSATLSLILPELSILRKCTRVCLLFECETPGSEYRPMQKLMLSVFHFTSADKIQQAATAITSACLHMCPGPQWDGPRRATPLRLVPSFLSLDRLPWLPIKTNTPMPYGRRPAREQNDCPGCLLVKGGKKRKLSPCQDMEVYLYHAVQTAHGKRRVSSQV
jgi:hypothetical protein